MSVNVCFPFVGDSIGGSHISALMLIESLAGSGFSPTIVLHEEGRLADHLRGRGLPYELLALPGYAGLTPQLSAIARSAVACTPRLVRFMRDRSIDIVHTNDLRMNLTWPLACRIAGRRMVWHQRTLPQSTSALWQLVPHLATRALTISNAVAAAMRLPASSVVYNPFDDTAADLDRGRCRDALLAELGLAENALMLGLVGRIVRAKRPDLCVDILAQMAERQSRPVHLVYIGQDSGGLEAMIRQHAEDRGVSSRIHFLGFRFPVDGLVAGLDMLLAPSESEGFGRSVVEAQLAGTPVVASDIAAHVEIIGTGDALGAIAPRGEPAAYAEAALRLLAPSAAAGRATARGRIAARFGRDAHVAAVTRVYAELVGERRSRYATA